MAAHDLRSPVGVSKMVVQRAQDLLRKAAADVDGRASQGKVAQALIRATQAVETTAHSLNRLMRLVQQLLDVSRVKEGTLVLHCQPLDLAELVRTCVDEQRLLTPSRVMTLDLPDSAESGTPPVSVEADADRLSQVLTNYLANAVRYSPEDQPIEVGLQAGAPTTENASGRVVRVWVRDHGSGIPPEEQTTIWERFQRARSVHEAGGLGLGLYIARTMIDLHGGQVGVESASGQGATFWFTLPLGPGST
jgi:signal transduction histidine kinase